MGVKPNYAVGLDIGSRTTRMVICLVEGGRIRLLGCSAVPSDGWSKGLIADQKAVADRVRVALRHAEASAQVSVERAAVGMGGPTLRGASSRGVMELGPQREIDQRDINRVVDRASNVQLQEDRMVLQLFPQDFVVDGHPGHRDPRKMLASQLEMNVHLLTASKQEHTALVGAVNLAHLEVEETVFEALAACYATVLPEDRSEGIAVVDLGAHSTELVVYYGDAMHLASTVKVCGDHFTRDISQGLMLSFQEAETIKREFGAALAGNCPENIFVELPSQENREPRQAHWRFVNQILEARATEVFRYVKSELARVGMDRSLMGGIFLTGGAARLPDLCDVAERELQCQARYGITVGIKDWPDSMNDPDWSTAAGLAMYSGKLKEAEQTRQTGSWLDRVLR